MKINIDHSDINRFDENGKPMTKSRVCVSIKPTSGTSMFFSLSAKEALEMGKKLIEESGYATNTIAKARNERTQS